MFAVPHHNGDCQAALVGKGAHKSAQTLLEVCADMCGQAQLGLYRTEQHQIDAVEHRDLQDIIGSTARQARIRDSAAAGNHNLLFLGSLVQARLCSLLDCATCCLK